MMAIVVSVIMLLGASLMLLAAVGLVRLPDLPSRMHATTKSGALGTSVIMLAVILAYTETAVTARAIAIICFIMLTSPVAAHVIGRAGYFMGVPLWHGTLKDELKEKYDPKTGHLRSGLEGEPRDGPEP